MNEFKNNTVQSGNTVRCTGYIVRDEPSLELCTDHKCYGSHLELFVILNKRLPFTIF